MSSFVRLYFCIVLFVFEALAIQSSKQIRDFAISLRKIAKKILIGYWYIVVRELLRDSAEWFRAIVLVISTHLN